MRDFNFVFEPGRYRGLRADVTGAAVYSLFFLRGSAMGTVRDGGGYLSATIYAESTRNGWPTSGAACPNR
jgi:hypothetical protein